MTERSFCERPKIEPMLDLPDATLLCETLRERERWPYQVQLRDTDAAGVLYFANLLAICHGAYEASLAAWGIDLRTFVTNPPIALPITHTSAEFRRPIYCGDRLTIALSAQQQTESEFIVNYEVYNDGERLMGKAQTVHVAIEVAQRRRVDLPEPIAAWLASQEPPQN
jgi:1,4-dihydroxy-2-naphthoyl-CoA hydrolase